jgi:outer membrane lipoprotein LolB
MALTRHAIPAGRPYAALGLLLLAVAGGCTTLAPIEPSLQVYTGRFVASISRDEQREAVSGRFTLAASAGRTTLDLASPLGNTLARVEANANRAMLTAPQADGTLATWRGDSPEALAESVLGYRLPVAGLADWIAGRAAPGRPAQVFPEAGPTQRIEQDGWVITIDERFEDSGAPRRLSVDRTAGVSSGPSVRLRLVLDAAGGGAGAPNWSRP